MRLFLEIAILISFFIINSCSSGTHENQYPDCNSSDVEKMDTCLVGIPLNEAIKRLQIDTSQFFAFDEPPGILRGIVINLGDSCEIELYVERTSIIEKPYLGIRQQYKYIENQSIIGLSWINKKSKKRRTIKA